MRARVLAAAAAVAIPCFALGDFEGVLDSKMSGEHMNGTMRMWISKAGFRSDADIQSPEAEKAGMGKSFRMTTIMKASQPNVTYMVNESRKTYSVIEHKPGSHRGQGNYTIKRLGKDTVAGYSCERVAVTDPSGHESEMCVAPDMLGGSSWFRAFQQRAEEEEQGLWKALSDAGVKGLPIRWLNKGKDGHDAFSMELVSARKQSVPASTFEIPAGYTKSEMAMPMTSPEASKKMEEAMKKLSPEQRKQMEEMMKKYGSGGK